MSYRLPPSDDPDYLPYRGPVEREPAAGRYDEPLPIVGANPTAQRWLEDQAALIESHGPARQNPVYTGRNIPRPPPLPFRLRLDRFDNIALDDYYRDESEADPDGFSPIGSTPSTLGLTGRTARAVGATRSVARLWPSRDAIPSTLRQQSADPPADSILFTPSHTTAGTFSICQSQMHGSGLASRSIFTNPTHSNPSSSHPSSFHSALRRGVSVKSVKTMRSFFSTLLFHSSSTSLAVQTPALPLAAARPDSDIFPIGSLSRSNSAADDGIESSTNARMAQRDGGRETSPNLVIELNPNSPMTMAPSSRPDSDWTQWRSGFTGGV